MDLQLPTPIDAYVRATNEGNIEAVSECFAAYATVRDEGHLYEGLPAIKDWNFKTNRKYSHTVTPIAISVCDGIATLRARLSGKFIGNPVTADFRFALVGDRITSLQIRC